MAEARVAHEIGKRLDNPVGEKVFAIRARRDAQVHPGLADRARRLARAEDRDLRGGVVPEQTLVPLGLEKEWLRSRRCRLVEGSAYDRARRDRIERRL